MLTPKAKGLTWDKEKNRFKETLKIEGLTQEIEKNRSKEIEKIPKGYVMFLKC